MKGRRRVFARAVGHCAMSNNGDAANEPPDESDWPTDQAWARLRERITASDPAGLAPPRFARRVRWTLAAAAVLLVAAGVSWRTLHLRPRAQATPAEHVVTTGVGESAIVHLADGSVVTVGPASTLRYSDDAAGRRVDLVEGVANFDVVHDTMRPLRVRVRNTVVTDVGTEFGVRAYPADSGVQVSVTSGAALVSGGASDSVELHAGQVAVVDANGRVAKVAGTSAETLAAWVHGRLVFVDAPLSTVAADLARWFDVQIRIPDERLARLPVSTRQNRSTLSSILDAIKATHPVRYERVGNVVTLLPADR